MRITHDVPNYLLSILSIKVLTNSFKYTSIFLSKVPTSKNTKYTQFAIICI